MFLSFGSSFRSNAPMLNAPMLVMCKTIRHVVSSAAEAETYGVFYNAKMALVIIHLLTQMGHLQTDPTPIRADNSTSVGFVNKNIQMKQSKTWDMQLHWLRDKENQKFLKYSGTKEKIKVLITSQNIIQQCITDKYVKKENMSETNF